LSKPSVTDRDGFGVAVVIPGCAEWERFGFLLQGEASGVVAFDFGGFDSGRFEKCDEQGAEHVAGAHNPRGNAIDTSVEVIEANVDATQIAIRGNLASDGKKVVGESYDVVAVPANTATDVKHDLRKELEDAGDFI